MEHILNKPVIFSDFRSLWNVSFSPPPPPSLFCWIIIASHKSVHIYKIIIKNSIYYSIVFCTMYLFLFLIMRWNLLGNHDWGGPNNRMYRHLYSLFRYSIPFRFFKSQTETDVPEMNRFSVVIFILYHCTVKEKYCTNCE